MSAKAAAVFTWRGWPTITYSHGRENHINRKRKRMMDAGIIILIAAALIALGLSIEWRRQYRAQLNAVSYEEAEADRIMESKRKYVIIEYLGRYIRMTEYELAFEWPKMTREERRMLLQKSKPKDVIEVSGPNGEVYKTNAFGTSKIAKEVERVKRIQDNSVPLAKRRQNGQGEFRPQIMGASHLTNNKGEYLSEEEIERRNKK
jgi:hypothetical protein